MAAYRVFFTKSAHKEYRKLPKPTRKKIDEVLEILRINPTSEILRIKKLQGREGHYRIRVGDYRIIYAPKLNQLVIRVIRVGHRSDVYRYF